ncbi:hypothetical protein ACY2PI_000644 [Citrobacter amalonaticus]
MAETLSVSLLQDPAEILDLLLQPSTNVRRSISSGLYVCQIFIGSVPFFVYSLLATLFFHSLGYFALQYDSCISKVALQT